MPWICELCKAVLAHKQTLKNHRRIHTGEKPYVCGLNGCKSEFRLPHHLKKHRKSTRLPRDCNKVVEYASHLTNDPMLLLDAEIDSNSKQAAIPRKSTKTSPATGGVFDYPHCTRTPGDIRDCGHGKIDGRTNDTPQLVRTSTIPRKTGMNSNCHISDQAVLKIAEKLESMAENWTSEERANRRRIVLFRKTQKGSTVNATCQPVSVNERPTNSICISCIWWAERRECYVTSVDTIHLLEQLIAAPNRFSVEENNRIRRNLEGFHPQTVSEAKPDSEEFFRIIMGFSNPKPRNIEKDIKVFPWKILRDALKRVFGKYSISPSHTVSALNVDPDQRKFTTPEGQRILSPNRTSTTPQQACPVTEVRNPAVTTVIRSTDSLSTTTGVRTISHGSFTFSSRNQDVD
ncbi:Uncharacterized protein HZ326_21919 [Fusarium oxysporum f. sp. albedinis]|nr:Uncharacterized protein HZ326_21919 [Fusarium oxysporum f. sp. albedinis]